MSTGTSACERLAASRERLRQALQHTKVKNTPGGRNEGLLGGLLGHLQTSAGAGLVGDVLQAWWQKQPMRLVLLLALQAANALLQPTARRHPYALVLAAAAVGGVAVLIRPWRWISTQALIAGLLPQVFSEVLKLRSPKAGRSAAK